MRLHDAPEQGCIGIAPVLRRTPSHPHFPLSPFLSSTESRRGKVGLRERTLETPHAIVARAPYMPDETFLITLFPREQIGAVRETTRPQADTYGQTTAQVQPTRPTNVGAYWANS